MKFFFYILLLIPAGHIVWAQYDSTTSAPHLLAMDTDASDEPRLGPPEHEYPTLAGGIIGLRALLSENGIGLESGYTTDVLSTVSGGRATAASSIHNFSLMLSVDMERLAGWEGATLSLQGLGNEGATPGQNAGIAQGVSNIESYSNWRVYTASLEQQLLNGRASMLVGLYDLNSEFDVTENAVTFINPSFGIGYDIAQSGRNGPSIFPVTSLGVRIAVHPTESSYLQSVLLDAVPGDPERPTGTRVILSGDDGALSVTEAGCTFGNASRFRIALGGWFYTKAWKNQFDETDATSYANSGGYAIAEGLVFAAENSLGTTVAVFGRYGFADARINRFDAAYCGGVSVKNFMQPDDNAGIACTVVHNGSMFMNTGRANGSCYGSGEVVVEMLYRFQPLSWLTLQPDVQYVIAPDSHTDARNILVAGMRTQIGF